MDDGARQELVGRLGLPLPHQRGEMIERGMVYAWLHRLVLPCQAALLLRLHAEREVYSRPGPRRRRCALERVMNSISNGLGMRETETTWEPSRPWNPYLYAI